MQRMYRHNELHPRSICVYTNTCIHTQRERKTHRQTHRHTYTYMHTHAHTHANALKTLLGSRLNKTTYSHSHTLTLSQTRTLTFLLSTCLSLCREPLFERIRHNTTTQLRQLVCFLSTHIDILVRHSLCFHMWCSHAHSTPLKLLFVYMDFVRTVGCCCVNE